MRLLPALLALAAFNAQAYQAAQGDNMCLYGVRAATEAYEMAVYDPMAPNHQVLLAALKYRFNAMPFKASQEHAVASLKYIVEHMQIKGRHQYLTFEPENIGDEYVRKFCFYYVEVPE